jgi:Tfp pilus assembly protein PilV
MMGARKSMTLIEVLVAVVVCGAGLAVVAGGVAAAVRAEAHAGQMTRAADHADLVLQRILSGEQALEAASGDFSDEGAADLRWEVEVDTPTETQTEGLQSVTVGVGWTAPGGERSLSVTRWIFVDPLAGGVR